MKDIGGLVNVQFYLVPRFEKIVTTMSKCSIYE